MEAPTGLIVCLVIIVIAALVAVMLVGKTQRLRIQLAERGGFRELAERTQTAQQELRDEISQLNERVVAIQRLLEDVE